MRESGTRVFSRAAMTAALTPALALAYLDELSLDVRAAVVLGGDGRPLAGDAALAPRARELLAAAGGAGEGVLEQGAADGTLLAARIPAGGGIAVLAGPFALVSLLGHDLGRVAQAIGATARAD